MFVAFASPDPQDVDAAWRQARASAPGLRVAWHTEWSWCLADDAVVGAAPSGGRMAAGHARLRTGRTTRPGEALTALAEDAARAAGAPIARDGTFAFVTADLDARRLRVCRDAFGIRPAYWCRAGRGLQVSDDLEAFAAGRRLDRQFAAEFIALGQADARRTVWEGVHQLPPGGVLSWCDGRWELETFQPWSTPCEVPQDDAGAADEFRRLVMAAVGADLDDVAGTWADLSGGHDSSSVAAVAGWLSEREGRRFRGGVTIVDSFGHGDESGFADEVTRRYSLSSIRIVDPWPWREDGEAPPATPAPGRDYPHWARDRAVARAIGGRGDGVLLSGVGPDYYLPLSPWYAIDLLGRGQLREALKVIEDTAVQSRSTVWHTLGRYVLAPLAPVRLQARLLARAGGAPAWLQPAFADATGYASLAAIRDVITAWPGAVNRTLLARRLSEGASILPAWRTVDGLEIRHPLLSLPLVRFCLSLPRHLRTNFAAPKPILRHALADIVPPRVLARRTKGSVLLPRICWAFGRERDRLASMLRDSVLAAAGVCDPERVLAATDRCATGHAADGVALYHALSLESWLGARRARGAAVSW